MVAAGLANYRKLNPNRSREFNQGGKACQNEQMASRKAETQNSTSTSDNALVKQSLESSTPAAEATVKDV